MNMKIEIEPYISSTSYFFEKENSRCYITNEKRHTELILEGVYADLWQVILNTQDYKKVEEYAKLRNIDNNLNDFLDELVFTGLIKSEEIQEDNELFISAKEDNNDIYQEYEKQLYEKKKWIANNGFLYCVVFELSYKCNLTCKHCFNDKDVSEYSIDFSAAKKIIDEAIKLGVCHFCFTSGECTIHPDFIRILSYIKKHRKTFTIITNGQALYDDECLFENLVALYPHEVRISLYSMDSEVHDYITGVKGSHKKTVNVIRKLKERNVFVRIDFFQMSLNRNSLEDILKFREEINVDLTVTNFSFINNKKNNNAYTMIGDKDIYEALCDEKSPYYNLLDIKNNILNNKEAPICNGVCSSIAISPLLEVFPCVALKYKLGNLKEKTLESIFNNEHKRFLDIFKVKNLKDCNDCKYSQYCIYEPCMGMYENGFLRKSDICCKIAKIRVDILKSKGMYFENLE